MPPVVPINREEIWRYAAISANLTVRTGSDKAAGKK